MSDVAHQITCVGQIFNLVLGTMDVTEKKEERNWLH